jgi:hypothetical protein
VRINTPAAPEHCFDLSAEKFKQQGKLADAKQLSIATVNWLKSVNMAASFKNKSADIIDQAVILSASDDQNKIRCVAT